MSDLPGELVYRLGTQAVRRRAIAGAVMGVVRALAPLVLAIILVHRLGWRTPPAFWMVAGALLLLVAVRAIVSFRAALRRLSSLEIRVNEEAIAVRTTRDAFAIERARVARMIEVTGPLGGVVVESQPDPRSGMVFVAHVPLGGDGYPPVRQKLEEWRRFERRGRRGPMARLAVFGLVVAGIFFVPFFLDDFVAHSRVLGAMLVAGTLFVLRGAVRG
jgi:hypothetical protein